MAIHARILREKHDYCTAIAMQQNSSGQSDPVVQQDTLVYADIGPSSLNKKTKHVHAVTLKPDDRDDRVEYALLNHSLQKPVITTNHSIAGKNYLNFCACS